MKIASTLVGGSSYRGFDLPGVDCNWIKTYQKYKSKINKQNNVCHYCPLNHKALQQATDHKEKDKKSCNFNIRLLQRWII